MEDNHLSGWQSQPSQLSIRLRLVALKPRLEEFLRALDNLDPSLGP